MRKASTWYLFALVVLNVLLAFGTSSLTEKVKESLQGWGGGIPGLTLYAIAYYWWPYLFIIFTSVLALISIFSKWSSSVFYHFIIVCLIIEGSILFVSQVAIILLLPILRPLP